MDDEAHAARPSIAVIGTGTWGVNLVRDLRLAGADVLGVDPNPDARARASRAGASAVAAELDRAVDAIVVATPASTHEQVLDQLVALGVPVACEKPLAPSATAADRLAARWGDRLRVLHVWRHHPGVTGLRDLCSAGALGTVTAIRSTRSNWASPRRDVDPIWTLAPHDLSIALELLGHVPMLVAAQTELLDGRAVAALAHLRTRNGPSFVVDVSTRAPERARRLVVNGTDGVATWSSDRPDVIVVARGTDSTPDLTTVAIDPTPALQRQMCAVVDWVVAGRPMPTAPGDAAEIAARIEDIVAAGGAP